MAPKKTRASDDSVMRRAYYGRGPRDGMQLRRIMLDRVRTSLHEAITTSFGDRVAVLRVPKDLARRVNLVLGEPICSAEELERRRKARARLEELKKNPQAAASKATEPKVQAPVVLYFERDRNARLFERMKDVLDAKSIKYTLIDVAETRRTGL